MKKFHISMLLALAAWGVNTASAQDIYVYSGAEAKPVNTFKNVQRITFGEKGIDFLLDNGESTTVALEAIDHFTFFEREGVVGLTTIKNDNNICIKTNGKVVTVESTDAISNISLYSVEGIKMNEIAPRANKATLSLATLTNGVYVIKVEAAGKTTTQKIIKK